MATAWTSPYTAGVTVASNTTITGNGNSITFTGNDENYVALPVKSRKALKKKPVVPVETIPHDYIIIDADTHVFQVNKLPAMQFDQLDAYLSPMSAELGLLPPVVRYISPWTNKSAIVIIEQRPRMQLFVDSGGTGYEFALPWSHWVLELRQMKITEPHRAHIVRAGLSFSTSQMWSEDHVFHAPWTPNILSEMSMGSTLYGRSICFGEVNPFPIEITKDCSLNDAFRQIQQAYFYTKFNDEASDFVIMYAESLGVYANDDGNYDDSYHEWHEEMMKALSSLSIEQAIELVETSKYPPIQLRDVIAAFEPKKFSFAFSDLLDNAKNLSKSKKPPKDAAGEAMTIDLNAPNIPNQFEAIEDDYDTPEIPMSALEEAIHQDLDEQGWSPHQCDVDNGCPEGHYDEEGEHY